MEPATWPDVARQLIQFAEFHPWRFILTIPLGCGILLGTLMVLYKIVFSGPMGKMVSEFQKRALSGNDEEED